MWSVGCLAAEMSFCYPLFTSRTDSEHIKQIFELCGSPSKESWAEVMESEIYAGLQLKTQYPKRLISHLRNKRMDMDDELLELIDRMLTMNPHTRITIEQALEHAYFKDVDVEEGASRVRRVLESQAKKEVVEEERGKQSVHLLRQDMNLLGLDSSPVKRIKL